MKLKAKLLVTFATVLMVPVLLFLLCVSVLEKNQASTIRELYHTDNIWEALAGNSVQALNYLTSDIEEEICGILKEDPDRILEREVQESLEEELEKAGAYLVIAADGEICCDSLPENEEDKIGEQLLALQDLTSFAAGGIYIPGSVNCFVKGQAVTFSDGSEGKIFLLVDAGDLLPAAKSTFLQMVIIIVLTLFLIALTLTFWIYYTLFKPIQELRRATQAIKDGNLDHELRFDSDDEIGDLCRDFEEMRLRLKQNAQEKLKYDRESKELISNISHDLKTPITSIKGYSQGIMEGVASSPEKHDRYIRTIYNKACDMEHLIEELTFYSKIDTNKIPYEFACINVSEYFSDCVADLQDEMDSKGIEFRYRNRVDDDTMIIADAEQLKRVINNIIGNSVKYMDKPKQFIHMEVDDAGDMIEVSIEDNGRGIGSQDLTNIFERFFRTDASRNSSRGGSGIGLSIVRKVIEDHGGKVWATSVEGEGTTIHFQLRKYQEGKDGEEE